MMSRSGSPCAGAHPPGGYRAVFISDLHLGSPACKADQISDFLGPLETDYLYLIGDIIDGWSLKKRLHWPKAHDQILKKLISFRRKNTKVFYLPGNHDACMRGLLGRHSSGIEIRHDAVHEMIDGRRLLVVHGDTFDKIVSELPWIARLGSMLYDLAVWLNTLINRLRRRLGLGYWPLAGWLKRKVKRALAFIDQFERSLSAEARRRQMCGVVCGHIHQPEMRTIDGLLYLNDGDWVESCTALVEHRDGRLELLHWAGQPVPGLRQRLGIKGRLKAATA